MSCVALSDACASWAPLCATALLVNKQIKPDLVLLVRVVTKMNWHLRAQPGVMRYKTAWVGSCCWDGPGEGTGTWGELRPRAAEGEGDVDHSASTNYSLVGFIFVPRGLPIKARQA